MSTETETIRRTRSRRTGLSTPGDRLRMLRQEANLSREQLESLYDLSAETVKAWENGKVNITKKGIQRCIRVFGELGLFTDAHWLLTGLGMDPRLRRNLQHVYDSSEVEKEVKSPLSEDMTLLLKEVDFFKKASPKSIVYLVTTEEMIPFYKPGDYVGGRFLSEDATKNALGKDCIILTTSGDKFFRRFAADPNVADRYVLSVHSPVWSKTTHPIIILSDEEISGIAPVIWHRKPEENM